jgi:hypothetical protein
VEGKEGKEKRQPGQKGRGNEKEKATSARTNTRAENTKAHLQQFRSLLISSSVPEQEQTD